MRNQLSYFSRETGGRVEGCSLEMGSRQETAEVRLRDVLDHKLPSVELHGLAGSCSFDRLENRGSCGNPHELPTIASEFAGRDGNDEISTGELHERSFSNGRLWPEVDLSQFVELIGMIVE
jgi:hypothetical protein